MMRMRISFHLTIGGDDGESGDGDACDQSMEAAKQQLQLGLL